MYRYLAVCCPRRRLETPGDTASITHSWQREDSVEPIGSLLFIRTLGYIQMSTDLSTSRFWSSTWATEFINIISRFETARVWKKTGDGNSIARHDHESHESYPIRDKFVHLKPTKIPTITAIFVLSRPILTICLTGWPPHVELDCFLVSSSSFFVTGLNESVPRSRGEFRLRLAYLTFTGTLCVLMLSIVQ